MGWTIRGSNPDRGRSSTTDLGPIQPPVQWAPGFLSHELSGLGVMATLLHLLQRLRMGGGTPLLNLYDFMARTETFTFTHFELLVVHIGQISHLPPSVF